MTNPAIEVDHLTKRYRLYRSPKDRLRELVSPSRKKYHHEFHALRDISFSVAKGETVGIIGQNGSGKSTLLKIICGVVRTSSGSVKANGRISSLLELGAGFHPEFTGRDNVYMNGALIGLSRSEMDRRFPEIEGFADIGEYIDQPVKTYSSGMFVRLAYAAAIHVDPDILVIDEALAVGDMRFQLKCAESVKEFQKAGRTVLFVTHDIYSVRNLCSRAIWLSEGRIHDLGDVITVTDAYADFMKRRHDSIYEPPVHKVSDPVVSIGSVHVIDARAVERNTVDVGESFAIRVSYVLHHDFEGLVGGVALYGNDGTYVCGLNTKLDRFTLPDKQGQYELVVHYQSPALLSGTYHFHVGFFERQAVVPLDFRSKAQSLYVSASGYRAEGLCLLDHQWEVSMKKSPNDQGAV